MQDPAITQLVNVLLADQRSRHTGGVERLLVRLSSETGREVFEEWSKLEVTRMFLDALKSIAETYPLQNTADSNGIAMAFGCQSGIGLAVRLIEDPTRVFPSIFDGTKNLAARMSQLQMPEPAYVTPPDGEMGVTK